LRRGASLFRVRVQRKEKQREQKGRRDLGVPFPGFR